MNLLGLNINTNKNHKKEIEGLISQSFSTILARQQLSLRLGLQYDGDRKIYDALGYPGEEELDFKYYLSKYERQDIANAIIDRPVDFTWNNFLYITGKDESEEDSKLMKQWESLEERLMITQNLNLLDKLMGIGHYAVLLLGFSDVKQREDWIKPVAGDVKLNYIRPVSEDYATIQTWEKSPNSDRFGLPLRYEVQISEPGEGGNSISFNVHHSRILHYAHGGLFESRVFGRPRLKPIVNRLVDLEKLLGGSAEMYWRGARPGYGATMKDGYTPEADWLSKTQENIKAYENDLRRILLLEGVDLKALAQQIADPTGHIDVQLQAISSQTGIPKRILIGSERGELASSQDLTQWNTVVKTRMEDFAEPIILNPFVKKLQEHKQLEKVPYKVIWEDLFAPSDKEKAEIGAIRAKAVKDFGDSLISNSLAPKDIQKIIMGLDNDQIEEIAANLEAEGIMDEEGGRQDEEIARELSMNGNN